MVRIKDIAEKCGVSTASVSKALRGESDLKPSTAEKICVTAREMGYIPNANARVLKTNKSNNIGILFVDKTNSGLQHEYFSSILNSLKVEAERNGYDVTFISNTLGNGSMSYYQHAKYRNCDGVVIASVDFKNPEVIELVESEIPTVTIDYIFNGHCSVISDNVQGMRDIISYVYSKGHRKIAFIHGEDTDVTKYRLSSFYKRMEELNLSVPDEYVLPASYHIPKDSGVQTRKLLELNNPPTCIIYPDDYSLLGGMTEIERHNLKVPENISIVGYDGINMSRLLRPRLTTFIQNTEEIGTQSARKLVELINHPKSCIMESITVKGVLQEGETVTDIEVKDDIQ
jgi:Transcriptional regulators